MSVFMVDNDMRIREALSELLGPHGIARSPVANAGGYLRAEKPDRRPACIILDLELPHPPEDGLARRARAERTLRIAQ